MRRKQKILFPDYLSSGELKRDGIQTHVKGVTNQLYSISFYQTLQQNKRLRLRKN